MPSMYGNSDPEDLSERQRRRDRETERERERATDLAKENRQTMCVYTYTDTNRNAPGVCLLTDDRGLICCVPPAIHMNR